MTEKQVPGQLTREEAKNYILLTLDRFRVMTLHLNDNRSKLPSILNENKEILDLVYELEARNFYIDLVYPQKIIPLAFYHKNSPRSHLTETLTEALSLL